MVNIPISLKAALGRHNDFKFPRFVWLHKTCVKSEGCSAKISNLQLIYLLLYCNNYGRMWAKGFKLLTI